jgi:hypothetical protein
MLNRQNSGFAQENLGYGKNSGALRVYIIKGGWRLERYHHFPYNYWDVSHTQPTCP